MNTVITLPVYYSFFKIYLNTEGEAEAERDECALQLKKKESTD